MQASVCFLGIGDFRVSKRLLVFAFFLFYTIGAYSYDQKDSVNISKARFFIEEGTIVSGIDKEQIIVVKSENKKQLSTLIYISSGTVLVGLENVKTNGLIVCGKKSFPQVNVKLVNNIQKAFTKNTKVSFQTEVKSSDIPYNAPFLIGEFSSVFGCLPSSNNTFVYLSGCLIKEIISKVKFLVYENYTIKIQNKDFLNSYLLVVKFTTRPPPSLS